MFYYLIIDKIFEQQRFMLFRCTFLFSDQQQSNRLFFTLHFMQLNTKSTQQS